MGSKKGKITYIPKMAFEEAVRLKNVEGLERIGDAFNIMAYRSRQFPTLLPSDFRTPAYLKTKRRSSL